MPAPLSIRVAAAIWFISLVASSWKRLYVAHFSIDSIVVVAVLGVIYSYIIFGSLRLSRLPIVIYVVMLSITIFSAILNGIDYSVKYKHLGILAAIFPYFLFGGLVFPHWKRLSWRPFGPADAAKPVNVEVFS